MKCEKSLFRPCFVPSASRAQRERKEPGCIMDEEDVLPEAVAAPLVVEFTEEEIDVPDSDPSMRNAKIEKETVK